MSDPLDLSTLATHGGTAIVVTVGCGPAAGSVTYLLAGSVFAAGILGDAVAEIGTALLSATLADIPTWASATTVSCRFTATGDNVVNLTAGSLTVYLEVVPYP